MRSIKHFIEQSWLLVVAAFFFGLLIAMTNAALQERIQWNQNAKFNRLAKGLLPEADAFTAIEQEIPIEAIDGKTQNLAVYKAMAGDETVGWAFNAKGSGFSGYVEIVVAVDTRFEKIAGFDVLASSETPGIGDAIEDPNGYRSQFEGAPATELTLVSTGDTSAIDAQIVTVSGATYSSTAVVTGINHYLPQVKTQLQERGLIANDN